MTATNKLRELLDKCGVKWTEWLPRTATCWTDGTHGFVADLNDDGRLWLSMSMMTPEQAIAATLGCRELTAEQVRKCAKEVYFEGYNDGSVGRGPHIEETDWQWIAMKLNAKLGCETCHITPEHKTCHCTTPDDAWCFACSACGKSFPRSELSIAHNHGEINYCPNCGAKVVD